MAGNVAEYVSDTADGEMGFPPGVKEGTTGIDPMHELGPLGIARGGSYADWSAFVFLPRPVLLGGAYAADEDVGIRLVVGPEP